MHLSLLRESNIENATVLVRVDYNEPVIQGKVTDTTRIKASLPTLRLLMERQCKIVLISHFGKPKGKVVEALRMHNLAGTFEEILGQKIILLNECVGKEVKKAIEQGGQNSIFLLENIRFHSGEEENEAAFAEQLATLGEYYVNDAFSVCHRKHASVVGITQYLPSYAGLALEQEVHILSDIMKQPQHPFVLITGGAKVKDKIKTIQHLLPYVDNVLIGSAMARLFLDAEKQNKRLGEHSSKTEEQIEIAAQLLNDEKIVLPVDYLTLRNDGTIVEVTASSILSPEQQLLDIGTATTKQFCEHIAQAHTILWNGPVGVFEDEQFAKGSRTIAKSVAANTGMTIAGGGSTLRLLHQMELATKLTHLSTGGGALLKFLSGKPMPGLIALQQK